MSNIQPKSVPGSVSQPSSEYSYTPCTFGAFVELFECSFCLEYSKATSELSSDTNSISNRSPSPCETCGFSESRKGVYTNGEK